MSQPSALGRPNQGPRRRVGVVPFFAIYCLLLFGIPAQLIVPGMGANGSPAGLFALAGFGWWIIATLIPGEKEFRIWNPVRFGLMVYVTLVLLCWMIGKMRPLTALERSTSDRALMAMFGLVGLALVAIDGLRSMAEVRRVVNWVIGCSMIMVGVGLVQFFTGHDLARSLRIPGLEYNSQIAEIQTRSIFNRPRGTSLHPIEFGVVAAALLPLAYWRASCLRTKWALIPVAGLFLAAMASISRSAVLSGAVVIVVLLVGMSWKQRLVLVVSAAGGIVVAGVVVDGLVGTLKSLFTGTESDPSVQARLDRFPRVVELLTEYPWLGRGFGTYTPIDYFLLDNEIQKTAIETGLIGVAVLVLFIVVVVTVAFRSRGADPQNRLLGLALAAAILGIFISTYTFDAFFYKILMGMFYLSIGVVGAMWRLTAAERADRDLPDRSSRDRPIESPAERDAVTV